jgi:hypothetical protein
MSNAGDGIPSHDEQASGLSFEQWRTAFLAGAESHRLLLHAEAIGVTDTLRMLWKEGTAPAVQEVLSGDGDSPTGIAQRALPWAMPHKR